jgi:hypothetical protein
VAKDEVEENNLVLSGVFKETCLGSKHLFDFVELGRSAVVDITQLTEYHGVMSSVLIDEPDQVACIV